MGTKVDLGCLSRLRAGCLGVRKGSGLGGVTSCSMGGRCAHRCHLGHGFGRIHSLSYRRVASALHAVCCGVVVAAALVRSGVAFGGVDEDSAVVASRRVARHSKVALPTPAGTDWLYALVLGRPAATLMKLATAFVISMRTTLMLVNKVGWSLCVGCDTLGILPYAPRTA